MYVFTSVLNNTVLSVCPEIEYNSVGYPVDRSRGIAYPRLAANVYEVTNLPEITEPDKYCYTPDRGFYKNEQHREPVKNIYGIPDDVYLKIKDEAIAEVQEGAKNGKV